MNEEQNLPPPPALDHPKRRGRIRRRILRGTAALPAICTLLNGLAGFASIYFAAGSLDNRPPRLDLAAWMIFVGMLFDMLDGRVARLTRKTSEFGAQLDSLCDAITFGVAPAFLMLHAVAAAFTGGIPRINFLESSDPMNRLFWVIAAVYLCCAILRLARFNVENKPDEASHMSFKGLPSPAAAAVVASLVLLLLHVTDLNQVGWQSNRWVSVFVVVALPMATLLSALLMVTRIRYPHVINQYLRRKKPFEFLVKLAILLVAALLDVFVAAAALALGFALSGLWGLVWRRFHPEPAPAPPSQEGIVH